MTKTPHKCYCGACFRDMAPTLPVSTSPKGEMFNQLMILSSVVGHLHRAGEHHSAKTITEVQQRLYSGLEDALRKAKDGV